MATLHYWPIRARNLVCEFVAAEAGIKLDRHEPAWPAFKSETHFGQLPMLQIGDLKVSQSLAIVRVLARLGGIAGDSDADFALSEMLIQEGEDIYLLLGKAMYGAGFPESRPAAFDALFAAEGPVARHLAHLERLATSTGDFTSRRTAGEAALMATLFLLADLEPAEALLSGLPKLRAFYDKRAAAATALTAGLRPYFRREAVRGPDED